MLFDVFVDCWLFDVLVRGSLRVARCVLLVVCSLLFVDCCLLFVVCCLSLNVV